MIDLYKFSIKMLRDELYNIAIYCDFKTTMNLIRILPNINNNDLWREKVKLLKKPYFDFYTGMENYLIHTKQCCLCYSFKTHDNLDPYLYEYTPMLERIYDSVNSHADNYIEMKTIKINHIKQYILLGIYETIGSFIQKYVYYLGSFDTEKDAFNVIRNDDINHSNDFIIVNIKYLTPSFIHYKNNIKCHVYNSHWKMYDKYKNVINI